MVGYVCVLSTNDYLEGCLVLNENLKHLNSKYDLLCLINEEISEETVKTLEYFNIKYKRINKIDYKINAPAIFDHWLNTFDKFNIFTLTEYEKIIYLDTDLLILSNIDELADYEPLAMCRDIPYAYEKFNSGVMVLKPSILDYHNLMALMEEQMKKDSPYGDQDIINEYFKVVNVLPQKYNIMRHIYKEFEERDSFVTKDKVKVYPVNQGNYQDDVVILHYIGEMKPFKNDYPYDEIYSYLYSYYLSMVRYKIMKMNNSKQR